MCMLIDRLMGQKRLLIAECDNATVATLSLSSSKC